MDIHVFHLYNRLVRRKMTKPLVCSTCTEPYVLTATEDGDPLLQCFPCGSLVQPGLKLYDEVLSVVKEHFDI